MLNKSYSSTRIWYDVDIDYTANLPKLRRKTDVQFSVPVQCARMQRQQIVGYVFKKVLLLSRSIILYPTFTYTVIKRERVSLKSKICLKRNKYKLRNPSNRTFGLQVKF